MFFLLQFNFLPELTPNSLNGDGADDYIYVDPNNGDVSAWINNGKTNGSWQWKSLGIIASGVGAKNTTLQMVDFDGEIRIRLP